MTESLEALPLVLDRPPERSLLLPRLLQSRTHWSFGLVRPSRVLRGRDVVIRVRQLGVTARSGHGEPRDDRRGCRGLTADSLGSSMPGCRRLVSSTIMPAVAFGATPAVVDIANNINDLQPAREHSMLTAVAFVIRAFRARHASFVFGLLLAFGAGAGGNAVAEQVPTPESHLGYKPGADFHLAPWTEVVSYFEKVDAASDRVKVRDARPRRPRGGRISRRSSRARDDQRPGTHPDLFQDRLHDPASSPRRRPSGAGGRRRASPSS